MKSRSDEWVSSFIIGGSTEMEESILGEGLWPKEVLVNNFLNQRKIGA